MQPLSPTKPFAPTEVKQDDTTPSPRTVTALLTSALEVLQLYEVNPAIIVQLMSQVLFWLGSEVFNRMLGLVCAPPSTQLASLGAALRTPAQKSRERRRYLCRARATQIRLNLSTLDEWTRRSGLPSSLVSMHLAPATQLCSWVVAISTLSDFGAMVATVQQLRALSPPQLARAVQDYIYGRNETKLDSECTEYLTLLQADWHRSADPHTSRSQRPERSERTLDARFSSDQPDQAELSEEEQAVREAQLMVDSLFEPGSTIEDFRPAWTALGRPGPAGEMVAKPRSLAVLQAIAANAPSGTTTDSSVAALLLNSREMLPFVLPSSPDTLAVTPGDALGLGVGHFTGTGLGLSSTPLTNGTNGTNGAHGATSVATAGAKASSRPSSTIISVDEDSELASVVSGASSTAASASVFLQPGQGFGSGATWRPIPHLPEGMLEKIDRATRVRHPPVLASTLKELDQKIEGVSSALSNEVLETEEVVGMDSVVELDDESMAVQEVGEEKLLPAPPNDVLDTE